MRLHLNKRGIRALGIAESFRPTQRWSVLAGVVMRGDLVVDGLAVGRASVGGDDATSSISALYRTAMPIPGERHREPFLIPDFLHI
jgi:endonuclease V-like protein UPF0215 family